MAVDRVYKDGDILTHAIASVTAGDVLLVGAALPGVALTSTDDNGLVTVQHNGVFDKPVKGADGSGNAAVTAGDIIYKDGSELNIDDANGVRWGYALEDVASGATTTIKVKVGY